MYPKGANPWFDDKKEDKDKACTFIKSFWA